MIHCVLVYISSISVQEMISSKRLKRLIEDVNKQISSWIKKRSVNYHDHIMECKHEVEEIVVQGATS